MASAAQKSGFTTLPESAAAVADFNDTVQQLIYDLLMMKVSLGCGVPGPSLSDMPVEASHIVDHALL